MMRGLIFKNGKVCLKENLPDPIPKKNELMIRVALAGICATDLEISKGYMNFEGILGHEFVGYVEAPHDPNWDGVRVVGGINCACEECFLCRQGLDRHCPSRTVLGIYQRDGAFAERLVLPRKNLVPVPDSISNEDAVFAEPLAAVLRMNQQVEIHGTDRVAVLGDGRLGLLAAGVGSVLGWNVTLIGKHPEKIAKVDDLHASFVPGEAPTGSFDFAMDCTGSSEGFAEAIRILKPEGKLILKTTVADRDPIDLNLLVINEITIVGSRCGSMGESVDFLSKGLYNPSILTTARFPLSMGNRAFQAAKDTKNIKVLFDVSEEG